jgi:hypothetical protein
VTKPTNTEALIQEIKEGEVWLLSDGSFDPTRRYGTAAWILEGKKSRQRIYGTVITPGEASDISAYRCELAGILASMTVFNEIAIIHNLNASLTIYCDCVRAIDKAFFNYKPAQLQDASQDLLKAIHHERLSEHIKWTAKHIRGHQDDTVPYEQLDRPSQLNTIVDHMAKQFLSIANESQRHFSVRSNSWSICFENSPISNNIDETLYDIVHTPAAKSYWIKKSRIREDNFNTVNWQRLQEAMKKMSLSRRLFCTKHTSGMCGVGKFQKIWQTSESASCPHCGQYEDALHVWKCKAETVTDVWNNSLHTLASSLRKIDTDPELVKLLSHI